MQPIHISPKDGFNTFINILLGTGPILLPPVVAAAGIYISSITLLIMGVLNFICSEFVIETLSLTNCLIKGRTKIGNVLQKNDLESLIHKKSTEFGIVDLSVYEIKEAYEYSTMALILWGKAGQYINAIIIIVYLCGVLVSRVIIIGDTLSSVFQNYILLDRYELWVCLFSVLSAGLSFKNVAALMWLQSLIAYFRYLTIITMIGSSLFMIYDSGMQPLNIWNIDETHNLLGTVVYAFIMNHSIPQIFQPIQPQSAIKQFLYKNRRKVLYLGMSFSLFVFIMIAFSGMLAFPGLERYCYYNTIFDQPKLYWAYTIISLYMFLNISSNPVLTIVIRTNLMKTFTPKLVPANGYDVTKWGVFFTLIVVIPTTFISLVLRSQIQLVVGFTGGFLGVIIMMILPSLFVITARRSQLNSFKLNPYKSTFTGCLLPWIVIIVGLYFIIQNMFLQSEKFLKINDGSHIACFTSFQQQISINPQS